MHEESYYRWSVGTADGKMKRVLSENLTEMRTKQKHGSEEFEVCDLCGRKQKRKKVYIENGMVVCRKCFH